MTSCIIISLEMSSKILPLLPVSGRRMSGGDIVYNKVLDDHPLSRPQPINSALCRLSIPAYCEIRIPLSPAGRHYVERQFYRVSHSIQLLGFI